MLSLSCALSAFEALFQRIHQINNVFTARPWLVSDSFALAFCLDEFAQSLFVVVLKLFRFEVGLLLINDMLGQIEHVLRNFHVFDAVKVFVLVADFVGITDQRSHQTFAQWLKPDDVLPAGQHHAANTNHIHVADGFADDSKCVMPDLAVRDQIVGTD